MMYQDVVQDAIRDPTSSKGADVISDITPDILKDAMPSILDKLDSGQTTSEVLAEDTLNKIIDTVEATVLGDEFDLVFDKFADRIFDMMIEGSFLRIIEKISLLFTG